MERYQIRPLNRDDFDALSTLEQEILGEAGESVLCSYYLRLCCEFYSDTSLLVLDGDTPIGYLLCFVKGREAYCTTLAIRREYHRTRVIVLLLRRFVTLLVERADTCCFTAKDDNLPARQLHKMLGARDVEVM